MNLAVPAMNGGASQLRREITAYLNAQLLPRMEALFDHVAGGRQTIRIDRIVLDLGDVDAADWQRTLTDRILEKLRATLHEHQRHASEGGHPAGRAPVNRSPLEPQFEHLLYFLEHGRLPPARRRTPSDILRRPFAELHERHWQALSALVRTDPRARLRLVRHYDDAFLGQLFEKLTGIGQSGALLKHVASAVGDRRLRQLWRDCFWHILLVQGAGLPTREERGRAIAQHLQLVGEALEKLERTWPGAVCAPQSTPAQATIPDPAMLPAPWKAWFAPGRAAERIADVLEKEPAALLGGLVRGKALHDLVRFRATPLKPAVPRADAAAAGPVPGSDEALSARTRADGVSIEAHDSLAAGGAGMVILHPFLEELYASQGLLQRKRFKDSDCREQALQMLAWLAFGESGIPEYELLLAKLMCGLPVETPVLGAPLYGSQREACDELLLAVLRHWRALKSASPDWLRQQFLLREGSLARVDKGWKLRVEGRGQDILLSRLPWGFGVIQLPWMAEPLFTDWPH